jgi:(1->4)-alpha-D-glucan 1-alpha-D-glucosylmutase
MRTDSAGRWRRTMPHAARVPTSTYRLQLNGSFTFRDATAVVDYLHALGISDCYTSPFLMARRGSLHGYDVIDHGKTNSEIGTEEEFREFGETLRSHGMGLVADVVPNHVCISAPENQRWWDVLENGPYSAFAHWFDIDWAPPKPDLANKVLLPVLGEQYGRVLESQELTVLYDTGAFCVAYCEARFPLSPRSWSLFLAPALLAMKLRVTGEHPSVLEFESVLTALSHLPYGADISETTVRELQREKEVIKQRLAKLVDSSAAVGQSIQESLQQINGKKGDTRSFDSLERLLALQFYRLSYWRVAADEINYRRFFDINDLAAIRVEDRDVFRAAHARILELVEQGYITGIRVDHPDGLYDPARYFRDLQKDCQAARIRAGAPAGQPFFVICEKILIGDEELRSNWAIEGTTGYGFLNFLNGLFIDHSKRRAFDRLYSAFTGCSQSYETLLYHSKKLVLQVSMSSELHVMARQLDRISEQHRWSRDFTLESLRSALLETIACFPVYRTYITADTAQPDAEDKRHVLSALERAKQQNRAISESVFDFIRSVLLHDDPDGLTDAQREQRRHFVMRFQQFTGPVMAKGMEDTAFYRHFPLSSLNEVGGDLRQFGTSPGFFHAKNLVRRREWPNAMLSTSTHDSKRGEDVRALINVLSEIPADWYRAICSWRQMNRRWIVEFAGTPAPSPNEEYLFYQTLVGAWPLTPMNAEEHQTFIDRMERYMEKAVREAKVHSSWINPNATYEKAVQEFVRGALELSPSNEFLDAFIPFRCRVGRVGVLNALSQVLLKTTAPGVPDFYQGSELWNLALVDPDNRGPVDFSQRRALLEQLDRAAGPPAAFLHRLVENPGDGAIKLYITSRALRFRAENAELFAKGAYLPLRVVGDRQRHVIAFARVFGGRQAIVLAGRLLLELGAGQLPVGQYAWRDSALLLRSELACSQYQEVFTQVSVDTELQNGKSVLPLSQVFAHLPLALLVGESAR